MFSPLRIHPSLHNAPQMCWELTEELCSFECFSNFKTDYARLSAAIIVRFIVSGAQLQMHAAAPCDVSSHTCSIIFMPVRAHGATSAELGERCAEFLRYNCWEEKTLLASARHEPKAKRASSQVYCRMAAHLHRPASARLHYTESHSYFL